MSDRTGGPAFPAQFYDERATGMTLRDYFAAKAMLGIISSPTSILESDGSPAPDELTDADVARLAYEFADAMLKAREA